MSPIDTSIECLSFQTYLDYDDGSNQRYELLDTGELVAVPFENQANIALAMALCRYLEQFADWQLFRLGNTAIEVTPMTIVLPNGQRKKIAQRSRIPDLMCLTVQGLRQIANGYKGLALDHENPRLVVEVVSQSNASEDYISKRAQYAARGIEEYWIVDRHKQQVIVFVLKEEQYVEQVYTGDTVVNSSVFPFAKLTATEILTVKPL